MSIPPVIVSSSRKAWKWQWNQLMNGLAPADKAGNYCRQPSQAQHAITPNQKDLLMRTGRSLMYMLRRVSLERSLIQLK